MRRPSGRLYAHHVKDPLRKLHVPCNIWRMKMTLPEFIREIGDGPAAKLFGVKVRTVQSWRRREAYPYPRNAHQVVEACAGKVDYEGIYGPDPQPPSPPEARQGAV